MGSPAGDHDLLQRLVWSGSLPLKIRLAAADCRSFDDSDPYFVQYPRQSYIGFLLKQLHAFFATKLINDTAEAHDAWLECEGVPLKWHYPVGLLYDLYSGAEPAVDSEHGNDQDLATRSHSNTTLPVAWTLTIHYSDFPADQLIQLDQHDRILFDTFINSVKEADFIRNGTARSVMSLSKEDSDNLWRAVQSHDRALYNSVNAKLLDPPGMAIKNVPVKVYLPTSATKSATDTIQEEGADEHGPKQGHFRIVQCLISIRSKSGSAQTIGTALNEILPELFPSRRNPLLAQPVLHGAVLPMAAILTDLARSCAYLDGFLHLTVTMLG